MAIHKVLHRTLSSYSTHRTSDARFYDLPTQQPLSTMTEHEVPSRAKTMEVSNKHDLLVPSSSHQGREPSATLMDSAEKQDEESAGHLKGLRLHFTTAACVIYRARCAFRSNWQPAFVCASSSPISKFLSLLQLLSVLPTTSADLIEAAGSSPPIFLDMLVRPLGRYKTSTSC